MKRKLSLVLALAFMVLTFVATPVSAAHKPGDPLGWVLNSDVTAYIDGYPIRSYNINGYTYIVAEDLMSYGFNVEWRGSEAKLVIHTNRTAAPSGYTAAYQHTANTEVPGTPAFQYLYTNITTWIDNKQITGYNIGGNTCICMDDLAAVFSKGYVWNPVDASLRLTTQTGGTAPSVQQPAVGGSQISVESPCLDLSVVGNTINIGGFFLAPDKDVRVSGVEIYQSASEFGTYNLLADVSVYGADFSYTLQNMPAGQYYFKARAYLTVNGVKNYSEYSREYGCAVNAAGGLQIIMPELPLDIAWYKYNGEIYSTATITKITYTINRGQDGVKITPVFSGTKTGNGTGNTYAVSGNWTLTDAETGMIVDEGGIHKSGLQVGATFQNVKGNHGMYDWYPEKTYILEIFDQD